MKLPLIIFIPLVLMTGSCSGQNISPDKVPSVVLNALKAKYPLTSDVDWEKHDNLFEAELDINDSIEISVRIDDAGRLIMQKQDVPETELSSGIMNVLQNQYKEYVIDDIEKVEKNDAVYYQVELDGKGKTEMNLVFSVEGKEEKSISYWD